LKRAGLESGERRALVDELLMGNVLSAGLGQAPATQVAHLAGLPSSTPATIVNKVCASGMKAIMTAAASIRAGQADIIIAGGMESMSRAPYILPVSARTGGLRYGDQPMIDSLRFDGLTDSETGWGMGECAERCATEHDLSREQSDAFARSSYERAIKATNDGIFAREIVPVTIPATKGKPESILSEDECPKNVKRLFSMILLSIIRPRWPVSSHPLPKTARAPSRQQMPVP